MRISHIDHVNLRIPEDGIDTAIQFYRDKLGFAVENMEEYESGERSIFSFRLTDEAVLHVSPTAEFEPPAGDNYGHTAIVYDEPIEEIERSLEREDVEIDRIGEPLGATGIGHAAYLTDPFGYQLELKASPAIES